MLPYREIIELRSVGLSFEKIAHLTGCGVQKVKSVVSRAADLGLEWPVPIQFTDLELQRLVDVSDSHRNHPIDCFAIRETLKKRGIKSNRPTKSHLDVAWNIYLESSEGSERPPFSRPRFNRQYGGWLQVCAKPLKMLVNWTPAEEVQVDWAGKTIPVYGKGNDITPAYLFVATMPYSGYTFVRASLDMSMQSWLEHHCALFEFLGGTPMFIAPDNLVTAVTMKGDRSVPLKERRSINHSYQELADYYGVIVVPTRVRSPKDKGAVEMHVRMAANHFIGLLSHLRFTSIDQLNSSVADLTKAFNERAYSSGHSLYRITRKTVFQQEEVPYLAPLPEVPFAPATWCSAKASGDSVITIRGVHYGLPQSCAKQEVLACVSRSYVDVFTADGKQKVAHHPRGEDGSDTFEGFAGRRPDRFKPLSEWADQNNRQSLISQWHPVKNEGLTPHDVVCLSKKSVWWVCADCGYEWQEAPSARVRRKWDDCLACAGIDLVPGQNDLATLYPGIAAEWHPDKNIYKPFEVLPSQDMQVWWRGHECSHEWFCAIDERTKSATGRVCPYCSGEEALTGFNDISTLCPELAKLWHPSKNHQRKPETTSVLSKSRVFLWNGPFTNVWLQTPRSWMRKNGYADVLEPFLRVVEKAKEEDVLYASEEGPPDPYAVSKTTLRAYRFRRNHAKPMSLEEWCEAFRMERLIEEWHPCKNGELALASLPHGTSLNAWWRCTTCGHEWQAFIKNRKRGTGDCPVCNPSLKIVPGLTSLSSRSPSFLRFYSKENKIPVEQISSRESRQLLWECPVCERKWKAFIDQFPGQTASCPFCDGWVDKLVNAKHDKRDLASRFPHISFFWHPSKNGGLTPVDVLPYSKADAWWRCPDCGYEWQESLAACVKRQTSICPVCLDKWSGQNSRNRGGAARNARRHSILVPGVNDFETIRPDLAAEWHPTKNGTLRPSDVTPGSGTVVWWLCEKGHAWEANPKSRRAGRSCPYCQNRKVLPGYNDLATLHPSVAALWNYEKNGNFHPEDVVPKSKKRAWWRCPDCGHEWETSIATCTKGKGCPVKARRVKDKRCPPPE